MMGDAHYPVMTAEKRLSNGGRHPLIGRPCRMAITARQTRDVRSRLRCFAEPVGAKTGAQRQPGTVQLHPAVVAGDRQGLADLVGIEP